MKSPFGELRKRRALTLRELASALGTSTRVVSEMEEGKKRVSDKFFYPLWKMGEDAFALAVQQNVFIDWRREFHRSLSRGERPPSI